MSSFKGTLKVNGKEFEVISLDYSFNQKTDEKGRPASDVRKGLITISIVGSDDDSLLGWMIDPYKKTNGSVTLEKIDQASTLKELKFEDGYCVAFDEKFGSNDNEPLMITLSISARKVTVGNATHEDKW